MAIFAAKARFSHSSIGVMALMMLAGCGTAQKISNARLESLGITPGAAHWEATSRLSNEGYACFVAGAKRENFDCSKTVGFFPTCLLRVRFIVDDENKISSISVPDPACLGTP